MRHLYKKNECLKCGKLVLFGQFDIHKVSFGIKMVSLKGHHVNMSV